MTRYNYLKMIEYCAFAYQDEQPDFPDTTLTIIDDTDTDIQCYIRKVQNRLTITFRGTNSNKDRITDLKFYKKVIPYDNMNGDIRVHAGFISTYKSDNIRKKIHSLVTDDIKFVNITGHSYGAALAVLCGLDLQYNFTNKDYEVYLYGCPRVGNRAFKKSYNKRVFKTLRIENSNDAVTKVPFSVLGFCHVGIPLHIGLWKIPFVYSLKNHSTREYYKNLIKKITL